MLRREFLRRIGALTLLAQAWPVRDVRAAGLPTEIAGVRLPHSPLALGAADFARSSCPDFLFNHCMRTYLLAHLRLIARSAPSAPRMPLLLPCSTTVAFCPRLKTRSTVLRLTGPTQRSAGCAITAAPKRKRVASGMP